MKITIEVIIHSMSSHCVMVHQFELSQKQWVLRPRIVNYGRIGNDDVSRSWFR